MSVEQQEHECFSTKTFMEKNINIESTIQGYAMTTTSSYNLRDRRQVVDYKCDREGVDRNRHEILEEARKRKGKGSVSVDCPFRVIGRNKEKVKLRTITVNVPSTKSNISYGRQYLDF